ncbi:histidine phosphatase family protein [Candidatus Saccharibacteria bacterium]|nr:MAG: histidine phosphatase family protein [Candidatus Saccharibacteria bacterium]
MKQLYFIRHGQSELNKRKILAGHTDTPLTAKGREQAKAAGKGAHGLAIDCIVSSPLSRAHETAQILAREIGFPPDTIILNRLVIERTYGELEGTPWDTESHIDDVDGVETLAEVLARAHETLAYVRSLPYENILIASHGTFGLALLAAIRNEATFQDVDGIPNAEVIRII